MDKANNTAPMLEIESSRRDFIFTATKVVGALGVGALSWPLVAHMNPAADRNQLIPFPVDLTKIPEGAQLKLLIQGRTIFIRHRRGEEIKAAQDTNISDLRDPETDDQRLVPMPDGTLNRKFLVVVGHCTHFGYVPVGEQGLKHASGRYGGWYCPCHGANFDTSGRVRSAPAPRNLEVPFYRYASKTKIEILYRLKYHAYPKLLFPDCGIIAALCRD